MAFDNTINLREGVPAEATDEQKHKATRYVAAHSHDAEDCLELLRMLGLMDPGFRWERTNHDHGARGRRKIQEDQ